MPMSSGSLFRERFKKWNVLVFFNLAFAWHHCSKEHFSFDLFTLWAGLSIWILAFRERCPHPSRGLVIDCPSRPFGHRGHVDSLPVISCCLSLFFVHGQNFRGAHCSSMIFLETNCRRMYCSKACSWQREKARNLLPCTRVFPAFFVNQRMF